jgi:signal peptidase I
MRLVSRATRGLPTPARIAVDWGVTILLAIGFVLAFEAEVAKPFRIPTASMEPTLHCARPGQACEATFSDRVVACELCYRLSGPRRGQIVVFHAPAEAAVRCSAAGIYVKRLIGMPGDTVHEDGGGFIWVDGRRLNEPYVTASARGADIDNRGRTWHVPADGYFMMGDNRGGSCDSRVWGAVPRSSLVGPVILTYWPPNRISVDS